MATEAGVNTLELTVSNFGPIARGRVELRPMSVFVGPSNTGKSYLAVLTYALHQFLGSYSGNSAYRSNFDRMFTSGLPAIMPTQDIDLSADDIAVLNTWAQERRPRPEAIFHPESSAQDFELPEAIAALVRRVIRGVGGVSEVLDSEIVRCFGIDKTENLIRYPNNAESRFAIHGKSTAKSGYSSSFRYEITLAGQSFNIGASIPDALPIGIGQNAFFPRLFWLTEPEGDEKQDNAHQVLGWLARSALSHIVGPLGHPAHYLPADRAGVMHAHQVAVRGLIAGASRTALRRDSPMPILSGVLGDFLEQLVSLASEPIFREQKGWGNDLALRLERGLMGGAVRVERSQIDYPAFVYRPSGWRRDLPLMNASSMVSELAPAALYLRHIVRPGDTLIIEEPESHLHPEMQVAFTRLLAAAVKSGVRIIITTHSEWVLEELANLVLMSELPIERREGIAGADLALNPDEVGAWFFEPNADGNSSVVREIPLDKEMGKFPSEFGLVTAELYNRFAKISNRIERLKEG